MARPTKDGLDYFPLDCHLDSKVRRLEAEHGNDGFAVYIKLLQEAFKQQTGEVDISDPSTRKILSKDANLSEKKWRKIVESCATLGLFSSSSFQNLIVTSNGIKKRIHKVAEERERAKQRAEAKRKAIEERKAKGFSGSYSANNPPSNPGETGEKKVNTEKEILKDEKEILKGESDPAESRLENSFALYDEPPIAKSEDSTQFSQQDFKLKVLDLYRSTKPGNIAPGFEESYLFTLWKTHGTDRMLWAVTRYGLHWDKRKTVIEEFLTKGSDYVTSRDIKTKQPSGISATQRRIITPGYYD